MEVIQSLGVLNALPEALEGFQAIKVAGFAAPERTATVAFVAVGTIIAFEWELLAVAVLAVVAAFEKGCSHFPF